MTVEEIRIRIAEIAATKYATLPDSIDSEIAHKKEDQLLLDVLEAIACGAENPAALAIEVLQVQDVEYDRWYS